DLQQLTIGGAGEGAFARQVEVAVVGQVDDRVQVAGLVGHVVVQDQLVPVVQAVGQDDLELGGVAGAAVRAARGTGRVALVAVRADQRELHAYRAVALDRLGGPDVVAEAVQAAVQAVHAAVDGQGIGDL